MDLKMSIFFDFCIQYVSSAVQAHPIGLKNDENGMAGHLHLIKGEYKGIDIPVLFKQDYGKKLMDILGTGHASLYLISDRMKLILEKNNFTGWKTFPIKLYDKKGVEISGYHGFSITGHCASIDYKKSKVIEKRMVPTGPICKFYKGILIDKWDGTDFFSPVDTYDLFITHRAADVLKKNKITNVHLENLTEYETSVSNVSPEKPQT